MRRGQDESRDHETGTRALTRRQQHANWPTPLNSATIMRGATSTLGPSPCWAASMRSVIGDSFLKAANATRPSLSFRASLSKCQTLQYEQCPGQVSVRARQPRTPRRQPRLLAHASAARARRPGLERAPIQRACNLEKRIPGPESSYPACRSPPGRQWPDSSSRQCTGRPSQRRLGDDSRPRRFVRHSPGGGPSWSSAAQARRQLMRHSGRRTRSPKFTGHCPGSGRPLGSINQTQSPHVP